VLRVDDAVGETLTGYSEHLRKVSMGLAADMTRRYAVIGFRIALIHAAVERSAVVTTGHLERALALTEYARSGMGWVFGQSLGNPLATLLLRHLQAMPDGLTATHITRHIIRDPLKRQDAIDELVRMGYAEVAAVAGPHGRTRTALRAVGLSSTGFPDFQISTRSHESGETAWKSGNQGHLSTNGLEIGLEIGGTHMEIGGALGTWLRPCRDYEQHQNQHRQTPDGWVCAACDEEEAA